MSVRIYYAWRVSLVRLNGFIDAFHDFFWEDAVDHIIELMPQVRAELVGDLPDWEDKDRVRIYEQRRRFDRILDICEDAARLTSERVLGFDIEAGLSIWVRGRYAYCVPIAERFWAKDWKPPKYAHEFGYWNSTDKPDNVSGPQWWKRKNIWTKLCLGPEGTKQSHNARRMFHPVIDFQNRNNQMLRENLWASVAEKLEIDNAMLDTTYFERAKRRRKWFDERFPEPV